MTSPCLTAPRRELDEYRMSLIGQRVNLLLRQHEAEASGNDADAAYCLRRIASIEARLRGIDEAGGK